MSKAFLIGLYIAKSSLEVESLEATGFGSQGDCEDSLGFVTFFKGKEGDAMPGYRFELSCKSRPEVDVLIDAHGCTYKETQDNDKYQTMIYTCERTWTKRVKRWFRSVGIEQVIARVHAPIPQEQPNSPHPDHRIFQDVRREKRNRARRVGHAMGTQPCGGLGLLFQLNSRQRPIH